MNDLQFWMAFLMAAVALNLSPGPDLIYILSRTITQGRRVGLASAAGVCSGALVHVCAAAFGISAIVAASTTAFTAVKYAGALYLLYLGIQALRSRGMALNLPTARSTQPVSIPQAFQQGVLIDVLNPKVAVFFMAFLPQFVRPEHGNATVQLLMLGAIVIVVAMVIESIFVLAAARATLFFRRRPQASLWLDRLSGSILIALGIKLALTERME